MTNREHFASVARSARLSVELPQNYRQQSEVEQQYKPLEVIGQGTFGKVYKVLKQSDGKNYALKVVMQEKKYKNRQHEIVKAVTHNNVVSLHDLYFSQKNGEIKLNLVMDLMQMDLLKVLHNSKIKRVPVSEFTRKLWAFQLLKALAYFGDINLCHRDLKPSNILIDQSTNELKLCDFGSAKFIFPGQANVCYMCSRYYRPPEMLFGYTDYATEIDMWGYGCILAEILTLDPLFCGDSTMEQIIEIFKIIGTPPQKYFEEAADFRNVKIPRLRGHPWKSVLKKYDPEPTLLDLIEKIFVFDRQKRIKPYQALLHPYFADLVDPAQKHITSKLPNLFKFDQHTFVGFPEEKRLILGYFRHRDYSQEKEAIDQPMKSLESLDTTTSRI